uniref:Uncharacterized protein n=1 Tax=Picea glauca TaxID=3330 RepID=A0A117NHV3_PICGL|nr:hypothetical protein ABT39_MTgene4273 [Picea glauca]
MRVMRVLGYIHTLPTMSSSMPGVAPNVDTLNVRCRCLLGCFGDLLFSLWEPMNHAYLQCTFFYKWLSPLLYNNLYNESQQNDTSG